MVDGRLDDLSPVFPDRIDDRSPLATLGHMLPSASLKNALLNGALSLVPIGSKDITEETKVIGIGGHERIAVAVL